MKSSSSLRDVAERLQTSLGSSFRVERELGGGGMSRVFLVSDLRLERQVVVKVLPPEHASALSAARFQREISVTALLQHPHILPILSAAADQELVYFMTPYVAGESLRDRLASSGALPVIEALRLLRELADALAYAHGKGVVHRDVKPANVLLTEGHAVLADFGVAHAIAGAHELAPRPGTSLGTPQYMAPEQLSGEHAPDPPGDVYALGVVAWEMLAGRLPFAGATLREVLADKLRGPPPRLQDERRDVPRAVRELVERAMAAHPDRRFPDAGAMRDSIDAALSELVSERERRRRRRIWWPALALMAAAAVAAVALIARDRTPRTLDADLIAVAPFEVIGGGPDLGFWREGLMDILAANLDGAGALRTVSPLLVMHRWSGRGNPRDAAALGRSTGAGFAVLGRIVAVGPDSARVTARLVDVASGDTRAELDWRDDAEHLDRLGDSLSIGLLREIGQIRPVGAVRRESIKARGLPALKAFLQGEQYFRRTEWDSARAAYGRAIALDSTFALALARMGRSYSWQRYGFDSLAREFALRAGAHNQGLAPRESLLILADSLRSVVYAYQRDPAYFRHARRLFETLDSATARYPEDPEAWYALGDARFHFGIGDGLAVDDEKILGAFDRAIALDSSFAPAHIHPVEIGLGGADPSRGIGYARGYLALGSTAVNAEGTALALRLVAPRPGDAEALRTMLDTATADVLFNAYSATRLATDTGEAAIALLRRIAEGRKARYGAFDPPFARARLARQLSYRGHLRAAATIAEAREAAVFAVLAELGAVPDDTARAVFARWLRTDARDPILRTPLTVDAMGWWASRRDTASIRAAESAAAARARAGGTQASLAAYEALVAAAHLALARGDSADAIRRFDALPRDGCPLCLSVQLVHARLLSLRGVDARAREILRRRVTLLPSAFDVLFALERARAAARAGDAEEAAAAYGLVARAWARGDPSLASLVAEARQGVGRVGPSTRARAR